MEEVSNKYHRGKIYKIVSNCCNDIYIGSTTETTLAKRLSKHRGMFKNWKSGKGNYVSSYKIFEQSHYDIVLIETYKCESKDELHSRERYWIENTANCINKYIPTRTDKEYYTAHQKEIKEHANQKSDCECGGKYTTANKSKHCKTKKHLAFINKLQEQTNEDQNNPLNPEINQTGS